MKRGRDKFQKYVLIIKLLIHIFSLLPKKLRIILFNSWRGIQGYKGLVIRYVLLKTIAAKIGENVSVYPDVYIFNPEKLSIGDNVSIHPMSYFDAKGGISIGNDVSIAHSTTILSTNHIYSSNAQPIKDQGLEYKKTEIESNVWVGAKSSILAGVVVKSGTILATGTVLTKSTGQNEIIGGVPGKVLRIRN